MIEAIHEPILQAGLVNLDPESMGIHFVLFVLFALMLNALVIQPMLRTHQARFDRMQGARNEAEKMDLRAAEAHTSYTDKMGEARRGAVSIRENLKSGAEAEAKEAMSQASDETSRALESGRSVLAEAVGQARPELDGQVDELAQLIADRILSGKAGSA